MVSEQFTHQNVFSAFGANQPALREGHIRSEGALGTLYAGTFGGVVIPLFLWLWTQKKSKWAAYAGLAGATAMVFASHASTSWGAYGGSLLGLAFWPLRKRMQLVRWGIVATLVGLHLVMHGPVWSLLEKIDLTGGSSSYHRYMLVDNCIRHFSDWWLIGCKNYGDWGFDMWDLCNQFVVNALTGGLVTLVLYLTIFKRSFGEIGTARKLVGGDRRQEWLFWCLGSPCLLMSSHILELTTWRTYRCGCSFCSSAFLQRPLRPIRRGGGKIEWRRQRPSWSSYQLLPQRRLVLRLTQGNKECRTAFSKRDKAGRTQ